MKYRDMMNAYRNGQLSDELAEKIRDDIEKQEVISEYLLDRMEEEWELGEKDFAEEQNGEERERKEDADQITKQINRSIRKAFLKMGAVITAILLVAILFFTFGLSPLVSLFYYDPGKEVTKSTDGIILNQMSLDYGIYSNLTMPGKYRDYVSVVDQGFGKYNIEIVQNVTRTDQFVNVGGYIDKGKMTLFNTNVLKKPSPNLFAGAGLEGEGSISEKEVQTEKNLKLKEGESVFHWRYASKEEAVHALEKLDEDTWYMGYVTFENTMSFQEMQNFIRSLPEDTWAEWCGVNTADEKERSGSRLGYFLYTYSDTYNWKIKGYPNLSPVEDGTEEGTEKSIDEKLQDEQWCQEHMISMLKYLADQKQFLKLFGETGTYYNAAASYLEEHPLTYYGIVIGGKKADFLELVKSDRVYGICGEKMS